MPAPTPPPRRSALSRVGLCALACSGLLAAAGCALPYSLKPGDSLDVVRQRVGRPASEQVMPEGGHRLLYPLGKARYLLTFDALGRLQTWENVLDEAHFARIGPGMTGEQVQARLGAPDRVWHVRYHDQTVWSYRFETPFCLLFHVGLTPQGVVEDTSYGPDPRCERDRHFLF